jgi:tetratricopeptide (TPR) repeat protein
MSRPLSAIAFCVLIAVSGLAFAAPDDNPPAPPPSGDKGKQKGTKTGSQKQSSDQEFRDGYRRAHELIMKGDYMSGIPALRALGKDDHPDVANYLGYAHRKIGDYVQAKYWYERALAADPRHVRTWSYYGMWQVEMGNLGRAEEYLAKIRVICGNEDCREFKDLQRSLAGEITY